MKISGWKLFLSVSLLMLSNLALAELIDRGNGMIYDTVLGITWLQDANYAQTSGYDEDGYMTWYEATEWADQLVYEGFNDWRLASVSISTGTPIGTVDSFSSIISCHEDTEEACRDNEFGYMFVYNLGGMLGEVLTGNQTSISGVELNNIQYGYTSNNEYADFFETFTFFFAGGAIIWDSKTSHWAAWAVRDGDIDDPSCQLPAKPDELTAEDRGGTIYLSWEADERSTSYDVYRNVNDSEFNLIDNTEENWYEDTVPNGAELVEYYVVGLNECGDGTPSEVVYILFRKGKRR